MKTVSSHFSHTEPSNPGNLPSAGEIFYVKTYGPIYRVRHSLMFCPRYSQTLSIPWRSRSNFLPPKASQSNQVQGLHSPREIPMFEGRPILSTSVPIYGFKTSREQGIARCPAASVVGCSCHISTLSPRYRSVLQGYDVSTALAADGAKREMDRGTKV